MKWLLLLFFVNSGHGVDMEVVEFDSKNACALAKISITNSWTERRPTLTGFCVPK